MSDRRLSEITPEELARVMEDAKLWTEGECPAAYGWRVSPKEDRWEMIEAAALALLVLRGEEAIPTRQVDPYQEDLGTEPMGCWAEHLERLGRAR